MNWTNRRGGEQANGVTQFSAHKYVIVCVCLVILCGHLCTAFCTCKHVASQTDRRAHTVTHTYTHLTNTTLQRFLCSSLKLFKNVAKGKQQSESCRQVCAVSQSLMHHTVPRKRFCPRNTHTAPRHTHTHTHTHINHQLL
jgi:hypothetical protein